MIPMWVSPPVVAYGTIFHRILLHLALESAKKQRFLAVWDKMQVTWTCVCLPWDLSCNKLNLPKDKHFLVVSRQH